MPNILCPKCRRPAERRGELVAEDGTVLSLFVCENEACQVALEVGGESIPSSYTFAVSPDGNWIDPHAR